MGMMDALSPPKAPPTLGAIMEVSAQLSGERLAALKGEARQPGVIRARMVAYVLARESGYSMSEIGQAMGGRDHTTVLHGLRRFEALAPADQALRALHASARHYLELAARPAPGDTLRARLVARLCMASADELACVARFLGVVDE